MELQISAKLQGMLEAYNILGSGKSSIINIGKPEKENEIVKLHFNTNYARAFKEGYFQLEEN